MGLKKWCLIRSVKKASVSLHALPFPITIVWQLWGGIKKLLKCIHNTGQKFGIIPIIFKELFKEISYAHQGCIYLNGKETISKSSNCRILIQCKITVFHLKYNLFLWWQSRNIRSRYSILQCFFRIQHLFEIETFCYIINVFTVTFDQLC